MKLYEIKYKHSRNIAGIRFLDGMEYRIYIEGLLSEPNYEIEKEVGKDNYENTIVLQQVLKKIYTFSIGIIKEQMLDALHIMSLCDNVILREVESDDILNLREITIEKEKVEGDFYDVIINFVADIINDKGCNDEQDMYDVLSYSVDKAVTDDSAEMLTPSSSQVGNRYLVGTGTGGYIPDEELYDKGIYEIRNVNGAVIPVKIWENLGENSIITNNDDGLNYYYDGANWLPIPTINLSSPAALKIKVYGKAVKNTLIKIEYKKSTDTDYTLVTNLFEGSYNDGYSWNVLTSGTYNVKVTCYTNSGTYQSRIKNITV